MINAGITISPFDGNQSYNATTETWEGITVKINYPSGQTSSANAPVSGDFLIEPSGPVWEVTGVENVSGNTFRLNLIQRDKTPSSTVSPSMGLVNRGAITTPKKGMLSPFWDPSIVAPTTQQIAKLFDVEKENGVYSASEDTSGAAPAEHQHDGSDIYGIIDAGRITA